MKHKKRSPILAAIAVLLIMAGVCVCAGIGLFSYYNAAPATMGAEPLFTVSSGESGSEIAERLQRARLIRSASFFKVLIKLERNVALKVGTYRVESSDTSLAVLSKIASGKEELQTLTVPEGLTLRETAQLVDRKGICPSADFLAAASDQSLLAAHSISAKTAEGYLYPDTYKLPLKIDARRLVEVMLNAFESKLSSLPNAKGLSPEQVRDKIILASIVEREYRVDAEAPLMASVFYNRLAINMALQSCATVVYVITEHRHRPHPSVIYDLDIAMQDPYNTYVNRGLPPGPISNPGKVALMAAFAPARTNYLYFRLIDPQTGEHHFSETFNEHAKAGELYTKAVAAER
jgi:UPF0755 protein